jgi:hypothetical protein
MAEKKIDKLLGLAKFESLLGGLIDVPKAEIGR